MSERVREKVGTADIPRLASEIADTVFMHGVLIEKREATTGKAGKWRKEHGFEQGGVQKTLMVTVDGEKDLTGIWRHKSRMEVKIVQGADQVELKAVLMAPDFKEAESLEVNGERSMDLAALADALATAKRLMAIDAKAGGREKAVEGTRAAVHQVTSPRRAQAA